ncbi:LlaJI family restriction endonuclease [Arcobacter porcinus]|uniref:LlaJI family restriction endonuclease n=1 Tax=Arcobacter porcinus TaxID=1935204 RepID=UPI00081F27DA|nr:LlaJI family restriction endonuclease [Arcobacter porcinus]OCL81597.1 LlaJI restriction endonuclease [Arcobacter porcinus]
MKILIENKYYDEDLRDYIPQHLCTKVKDGWKVGYVGYYNYKGKITFILPKGFDNFDSITSEKDFKINSFNSSWPIIIYKTLKKYINKYPKSTQVSQTNINEIISNLGEYEYSIMDIIFSLLNIHKNNPYIFFKEIEYSKKTKNKQSWKKTIKNNIPLIDKDIVIYLNIISRNSINSSTDQLLLIYYSTLYEISKYLNLSIELNDNIPILKNHQMTLLKKKVNKILKEIKSNYFNDLHQKIHFLLTQYYNVDGHSSKKELKSEFLLTSNFELIFEDMVDEIISDKEASKLFKYHKDGKILDHIYYDKSVINELKDYNTFYIGDSKYYSDWKTLINSEEPIYKQYTYTTNIINQCVNSNKKDVNNFLKNNKIIFWDTKNRSYHPIINFFILPNINSKMEELIQVIKKNENLIYNYSYHYKERAFDRNTHIILYFKINLHRLFLLYLNEINIEKDRVVVRNYIREKSTLLLKSLYKFKKNYSINQVREIEKDGLVFSYKNINISAKNK